AEADGDAIRDPLGPLPKEFAAFEAEDAAPHAVEVDRDDGDLATADDLLQAALEGQHVASPADGAFGEAADHVTFGEGAARGADGFDGVARDAGADRDRLAQAEEPVDGRQLIVGLPHHEADEALHAGADQEAIDVRHVIGDEERGAAEGYVFGALDFDAEER